jgi:hypothetical protein
MGCEARKLSAAGEVFFLDSYLYRTFQAVAASERNYFTCFFIFHVLVLLIPPV